MVRRPQMEWKQIENRQTTIIVTGTLGFAASPEKQRRPTTDLNCTDNVQITSSRECSKHQSIIMQLCVGSSLVFHRARPSANDQTSQDGNIPSSKSLREDAHQKLDADTPKDRSWQTMSASKVNHSGQFWRFSVDAPHQTLVIPKTCSFYTATESHGHHNHPLGHLRVMKSSLHRGVDDDSD